MHNWVWLRGSHILVYLVLLLGWGCPVLFPHPAPSLHTFLCQPDLQKHLLKPWLQAKVKSSRHQPLTSMVLSPRLLSCSSPKHSWPPLLGLSLPFLLSPWARIPFPPHPLGFPAPSIIQPVALDSPFPLGPLFPHGYSHHRNPVFALGVGWVK